MVEFQVSGVLMFQMNDTLAIQVPSVTVRMGL